MKVSVRLLIAALLSSAAANAINVPVPIEGATLNLNIQLQPWFQVQEDNPAPNVGEQFYFRRVRILAQGNFTKEILFLIQIDSPNFGKGGDYQTRELIQDAWISWNPTEGVYLDAGLLLLPFARHILQSTTSYTNMDFHSDSIAPRMPNTNGFRDMGVSLRGWFLDKKIGYRVGAYTGNRAGAPTNATGSTPPQPANVNHGGTPRFAGFFNFNLVGSEEGAWLYQGLYFDKPTIVSVGVGGEYQPGGVVTPYGVTDHKTVSADIFADVNLGGDSEFIFSATGYRFDAGGGNANTGFAGFVDIGYRMGPWQPYISGEFFKGDGCDTDATTGVNITPCTANTNEWRTGSIGLNYWIKRNTLHINSEYALIRSGNLTPAAGLPQKHQQRFTLGATMFY